MKHILGEEASSGMVPAYAAFSVLLTVLHSPQARCVSVNHPDYNFELRCTEVTMSQKWPLPLLKIANYGSVTFSISSQLQAESTKIRLKCKAGEGMLDPSLEKGWEGGRRRNQGILHQLRGWREMVGRVPGHLRGLGPYAVCLWVEGPRSLGLAAEVWGAGEKGMSLQVYPMYDSRECFETFILLISLKLAAFLAQIFNSQNVMQGTGCPQSSEKVF